MVCREKGYLRVVCVVVGCDDEAATSAFDLIQHPPPHEARTDLRATEGFDQATARKLRSMKLIERLGIASLLSDLRYQTSAAAINIVNNQTSFPREQLQHLFQHPSTLAVISDPTARSAEQHRHRSITAFPSLQLSLQATTNQPSCPNNSKVPPRPSMRQQKHTFASSIRKPLPYRYNSSTC